VTHPVCILPPRSMTQNVIFPKLFQHNKRVTELEVDRIRRSVAGVARGLFRLEVHGSRVGWETFCYEN
jgi:hypothetical protein